MVFCMPKHEESLQQVSASQAARKVRPMLLCRHHPYLLGKIAAKSKQTFCDENLSSYLVSPFLSSALESHAPEFVAQIVCLIWFGTDLIPPSLTSRTQQSNLQRSVGAFPKVEFLSWNRNVLSNINVSKNVIFLALLFIYRLKERNPFIQGKPGSEYRLLTIALVLGNKFLDDNTYTNKTWAEITGIFIKEIHVMETEFLTNIRYSLFVSKSQWEDWQTILERLWIYSVGLIKIQSSLRNALSTSMPISNSLFYTNNLCSSQLMFAASTQIISLVPPRACLKESPMELKCMSHISNTFNLPSVIRILPNSIRMSCCRF